MDSGDYISIESSSKIFKACNGSEVTPTHRINLRWSSPINLSTYVCPSLHESAILGMSALDDANIRKLALSTDIDKSFKTNSSSVENISNISPPVLEKSISPNVSSVENIAHLFPTIFTEVTDRDPIHCDMESQLNFGR